MQRKNGYNKIKIALAFPLILVAAGMLLNMISDDSVFAPAKRIFQFTLNLLSELTKPDIVPSVIALFIAVGGGYWYWTRRKP